MALIVTVKKPRDHPFLVQLDQLPNAKAREAAKAIKIEQLARNDNWDFTDDEYQVRFLSKPKKRQDNDLLEFNLEVRKNGVLVQVDNPFLIKNPPVMIPDGTVYETEYDGMIMPLPNLEYNPKKALQQSIISTLKSLKI